MSISPKTTQLLAFNHIDGPYALTSSCRHFKCLANDDAQDVQTKNLLLTSMREHPTLVTLCAEEAPCQTRSALTHTNPVRHFGSRTVHRGIDSKNGKNGRCTCCGGAFRIVQGVNLYTVYK